MAGDRRDAEGLLAELEVGRRVPDGDLPGAIRQLRLLQTQLAADTEGSGRQQLRDVDRLDPPWPRLDVGEHLPQALLPGVDVDGVLELHGY